MHDRVRIVGTGAQTYALDNNEKVANGGGVPWDIVVKDYLVLQSLTGRSVP